MVRRCVVGGCSNTTKNGTALHKWPKDEKVGKTWTRFVKNTRVWKGPSEWSLICSAHFDRECFEELNSVALEIGYKPKLKATAVPTIKKATTSSGEDSENTPPSLPAVQVPESEAAILRNTAAHALLDLGGSLICGRPTSEPCEERCAMELELNEDNISFNTEKNCTLSERGQRSAVEKRNRLRVLQEIDLQQSKLPHKHSKDSRTRPKPNKWTRGVQVKPVMVSTATQCELLKPPEPEVEDEDTDIESDSESDSDGDYEPCDDEHDDSDTDDVFMRDGSRDGENNRFFLVSESSLMKLFYSCPRCHSECDSNVQRIHGSCVCIVQRCRSCDYDFRWTSQPSIGDIPSGNLHMSAAILFSGAGISKSFRFLDHLGVPRISYSTFTTHQNRYLQPSIHSVWKDEQQKVLEMIQSSGGSFNAAGDGRCDSPGHSAKFGTYSLLDTDLNKVVHLEVVTVTEVSNSNCMEKEGLVRALAHLEANNLQLKEITTDRHVSIRKYLREKEVHHTLDVWHTSKGLGKKVDKLGKTKAFNVAAKWKKSICNHMYWCASSTPDGHPDVMEAKWLSLVNHIQNIHIHDNPYFPNCLHGPLNSSERKKKWLSPNEQVTEKLTDLLVSKPLLKDIRMLSTGSQTSNLENFHAVMNHFAPKMICFSYHGMISRSLLAALHYNENAGRPQARTQAGEERYAIAYPKYKNGAPTVRRVLVDCTYNYVRRLKEEVFILASNRERRQTSLHQPPTMAALFTKTSKSEAIANHKSRFAKL